MCQAVLSALHTCIYLSPHQFHGGGSYYNYYVWIKGHVESFLPDPTYLRRWGRIPTCVLSGALPSGQASLLLSSESSVYHSA